MEQNNDRKQLIQDLILVEAKKENIANLYKRITEIKNSGYPQNFTDVAKKYGLTRQNLDRIKKTKKYKKYKNN